MCIRDSLYIADDDNQRVLKETPTTGGYTESVIASFPKYSGFFVSSIAVDGSGNVYFVGGGILYEETPVEGSYTQSIIPTTGINITGIAADASGNVYIADNSNKQVVKLSAGSFAQTVIPIASPSAPTGGIAVDDNGNLYLTLYPLNGSFGIVKETLSPAVGSYFQKTIATGPLFVPGGIAVDAGGNVYIANTGTFTVLKEDFADPPTLGFANTPMGSTSTDSPRTVLVENLGNGSLIFSDLSYPPDFPQAAGDPGSCSNFHVLIPTQECDLPIDFTPLSKGTLRESVSITDNNLNVAGTVQSVTVIGTGGPVAVPINWPTPGALNYGERLGAAQLDASSTVAGTFTYSPALGTVPGAGTQTLSATFTPANTVVYAVTTVTVPLVVYPAMLTVSAQDLAMNYGAALPTFTYSVAGFRNGDTQATAITGAPAFSTSATSTSALGSYPITVAQGTLAAANYTFVFDNGTLTINKAILTVAATNLSMTYGSAVPPPAYSIIGFVNGDTQSSATSGAPTLSTTVTSNPTVGDYLITVGIGSLAATNYSFSLENGSLRVTKATPAINWPTPAPITFGTALSPTQLDATSSLSGSFVYAPPSGTPRPGLLILSTTFTPSDLSDYNVAEASVTLTVNKAAQTITFAPPVSPVLYGILPINLVATSTSGLAVSFTVQSGPGTVAGSQLTITGAGTVEVAANQAGSGAYTAAPTITHSIVVNKSTPSVNLLSSATGVAAGKIVTFRASLGATGAAEPTGTITFLDGTTVIETVAVNSAGVATYATKALPGGSNSITASYSGDSNYAAVASSAVNVSVD